MGLWKLDEPTYDSCNENTITHIKALSVKRCKTAEKVRALAFNSQDLEIAALSLNGYIHLWRADTFKQVIYFKTTILVLHSQSAATFHLGSLAKTSSWNGNGLFMLSRRAQNIRSWIAVAVSEINLKFIYSKN